MNSDYKFKFLDTLERLSLYKSNSGTLTIEALERALMAAYSNTNAVPTTIFSVESLDLTLNSITFNFDKKSNSYNEHHKKKKGKLKGINR